jgi:hypothetical protein
VCNSIFNRLLPEFCASWRSFSQASCWTLWTTSGWSTSSPTTTFRFRQVWHLQQTRLMNQVLNSSPRFGKHIVHVSFCSSCIEHLYVFRSLTFTHLIGFLYGRSRATSCKSGQVDGTRIAHHPVDPLLQSQLHCIGELKHFAITMFVEDGKSAFKLRQGNAHFP